MIDIEKLTPTQDLVVELLIARLRLGQREFTVVRGSHITKLVDGGVISVRSHNSNPGMVYARLTGEAIDAYWLGNDRQKYLTPLEQTCNRLQLENDNLRTKLGSIGL